MLRPLQRQRSDDSMAEKKKIHHCWVPQRYISGRVSSPARGAIGQRRVSNCRAIKLPLPATSEDQRARRTATSGYTGYPDYTDYTDSSFCWMVGVKPRHSLKLLCKPRIGSSFQRLPATKITCLPMPTLYAPSLSLPLGVSCVFAVGSCLQRRTLWKLALAPKVTPHRRHKWPQCASFNCVCVVI